MNKSALHLALASLLLTSACSARLDPHWTIDEATPFREANTPWENAPAGALELAPGPLPAADPQGIPRPQAAHQCHGGYQNPAGLAAALRPGVGARLTLRYWSPFDDRSFESALLPMSASFDLLLRLVPAGGRLTPEETSLLQSFLATNRKNLNGTALRSATTKEEKKAAAALFGTERPEAAAAVSRNMPQLWNGLVRSLCVQFVTSASEGIAGVDGRPVRYTLAPAADMLALCRAIEEDADRRRFATLFLRGDIKHCMSVAPPPADQGESVPLFGFDPSDHGNSAASVAAASAKSLSDTEFYIFGPRVAVLAAITLQSPRFGDRGTEAWSLVDWEASGLCTVRSGEAAAIGTIRLRGGATFRIVSDSDPRITNRVERRIGTGYRYAVLGPDWRTGWRALGHGALSALSPADVTQVQWSQAGRTQSVACSEARERETNE